MLAYEPFGGRSRATKLPCFLRKTLSILDVYGVNLPDFHFIWILLDIWWFILLKMLEIGISRLSVGHQGGKSCQFVFVNRSTWKNKRVCACVRKLEGAENLSAKDTCRQPGEILVDSTRLARSTTIYNVRLIIYSKMYIYLKLIDFSPGNTNFSIFTIFGQSTRYIYRYSNNFTKYSKYWTFYFSRQNPNPPSVISVSNRSRNRLRMSDENGGHRPASTTFRSSV